MPRLRAKALDCGEQTERSAMTGGGRIDSVSASGCAVWLATAATCTAVCISVLAGWQRGGWLAERMLWVAIGAVLVVAAHLMPALCRSAPRTIRCIAGALWLACMAATCYGHATFFLMAQQHAGEMRAEAIAPPTVAPVVLPGRQLTVIAEDRMSTIAALTQAKAERCARDCTALRLKRATLAAQLDALGVETAGAKRAEAAEDRREALADRASAIRDAARADPVTSRLAMLLGTTVARVDLLSGLAFAGVLEGVACLLWFMALQVGDSVTVGAVTVSNEAVATGQARADEPVTQQETDVSRLASEIASGRVRATVADIRRHLGCSQSRASSLRRLLPQHDDLPAAQTTT
jgi:hypothetical protein